MARVCGTITTGTNNITGNQASAMGGGVGLSNGFMHNEGKVNFGENSARFGGSIIVFGGKSEFYEKGKSSFDGNRANVDPDLSTRFNIGTWGELCANGVVCGFDQCQTSCGSKGTGKAALKSCPESGINGKGYVEFEGPQECVPVHTGFTLNTNTKGELIREPAQCSAGTYATRPGQGKAENFLTTCKACPANAICNGGNTLPLCKTGFYSVVEPVKPNTTACTPSKVENNTSNDTSAAPPASRDYTADHCASKYEQVYQDCAANTTCVAGMMACGVANSAVHRRQCCGVAIDLLGPNGKYPLCSCNPTLWHSYQSNLDSIGTQVNLVATMTQCSNESGVQFPFAGTPAGVAECNAEGKKLATATSAAPAARRLMSTAAATCDKNVANEKAYSCEICPAKGALCKDGLVIGQPNYWRTSNATTELIACTVRRCQGEVVPYAGQGCREGHEGVLCGTCKEGWVMGGLVCTKCEGQSSATRAIVSVTFMVVFFIGVVLLFTFQPYFSFKRRQRKLEAEARLKGIKDVEGGDEASKVENQKQRSAWGGETKGATAAQVATSGAPDSGNSINVLRDSFHQNADTDAFRSFIVKNLSIENIDAVLAALDGDVINTLVAYLITLVSHMQTLRVFLLTFDIDWGVSLDSILNITNVFMFDTFKLPGINCTLGALDFYQQLRMTVFFPVALVALCGITYPMLTRRVSEHERELVRSCFFKLLIFVSFLLYIPLSTKILAVYACTPVYDKWYITSSLDVQCYTSDHIANMVIGIIGIVFVPLGVPLFYTYLRSCYGVNGLFLEKQKEAVFTRIVHRYSQRVLNALPDRVNINSLNTAKIHELVSALTTKKLKAQTNKKIASSQRPDMLDPASETRDTYHHDLPPNVSTVEVSLGSGNAVVFGNKCAPFPLQTADGPNDSLIDSKLPAPRIPADRDAALAMLYDLGLKNPMITDGINLSWTMYTGVDDEKLMDWQRKEIMALSSAGFIFTAFKPSAHWFENFECGRKLLLTVGIVFIAPGTSDQVVTALIIACASIMAYVALEPFNSSFLHRTKVGFATILAITVFIGLCINAGIADGNDPIITVSLIFLNVVLTFVPLVMGFWDLTYRVRGGDGRCRSMRSLTRYCTPCCCKIYLGTSSSSFLKLVSPLLE